MKKHFYILVVFLFSMLLTQSCTVQKRKFRRGWTITSNRMNNSSKGSDKKEAIKLADAQVEEASSIVEMEPLEIASEPIDQPNETYETVEEELELSDSPTELMEFSKVLEKDEVQAPPVVVKQMKQKKTKASDKKRPVAKEKVANPRRGEIAGKVLGVLFALVVLLPLFLVVFFIFRGNQEGRFKFNSSADDSFFTQSFKRSYNVVFKTGVIVLFVAVALFVIGLLLWNLYIDLGIWAVILVLLCVAAVIFVLYLLVMLIGEFFSAIFSF